MESNVPKMYLKKWLSRTQNTVSTRKVTKGYDYRGWDGGGGVGIQPSISSETGKARDECTVGPKSKQHFSGRVGGQKSCFIHLCILSN